MPFDYIIQRSNRRKTLAIQIKQGQVKVFAPTWVSEQDIEHLVANKQQWILRKLAQSAISPKREPQFITI